MWYRRKKTRKAPVARNKAEKCVTKWCRSRRAAKKTYYKSPSGKLVVYDGFLQHCWKCRSRMFKEKRPATYVLNMLRNRAKQRKVPFTLTLAEFKEFCRKTNYLKLRGNGAGYFTIDRIDWNEGYHIWNIRVMEFMENAEQGADNRTREERGAAIADENEPF